MSGSTRRHLVNEGPMQIRLDKYPYRGNFSFHDYYYVDSSMNLKSNRDWLVYSLSSHSIFCFPCCLFSHPTHDIGKLSPWQDFGHTGFADFGHISRGIKNHEQSELHYKAMILWMEFKERESMNKSIVTEAARLQNKELDHMKSLFRSVIDPVVFHATNNLSFRGSSDNIDNRNCGTFLSLIKLLSKYLAPLARHLEQHKKGKTSYLSNRMQNEFIELIADTVRNTIIEQVKDRKYFSILFDATPDSSRKEQISQVIGTVKLSESGCTI